jgi:hypothetical protein
MNQTRLLSRPAATLSSIPNGAEGRGEEVFRFMGRAGVRASVESERGLQAASTSALPKRHELFARVLSFDVETG